MLVVLQGRGGRCVGTGGVIRVYLCVCSWVLAVLMAGSVSQRATGQTGGVQNVGGVSYDDFCSPEAAR